MRRLQRRSDEGIEPYFHQFPQSMYHTLYFQAYDHVIDIITDRFKQPGFLIFWSIEDVLLNSCNRKFYEESLSKLCEMYASNFKWRDLIIQLEQISVAADVNDISISDTAQKMKFSVKGFFSKYDQICSFLQIWSHLLKKSLTENFIFLCSVNF